MRGASWLRYHPTVQCVRSLVGLQGNCAQIFVRHECGFVGQWREGSSIADGIAVFQSRRPIRALSATARIDWLELERDAVVVRHRHALCDLLWHCSGRVVICSNRLGVGLHHGSCFEHQSAAHALEVMIWAKSHNAESQGCLTLSVMRRIGCRRSRLRVRCREVPGAGFRRERTGSANLRFRANGPRNRERLAVRNRERIGHANRERAGRQSRANRLHRGHCHPR